MGVNSAQTHTLICHHRINSFYIPRLKCYSQEPFHPLTPSVVCTSLDEWTRLDRIHSYYTQEAFVCFCVFVCFEDECIWSMYSLSTFVSTNKYTSPAPLDRWCRSFGRSNPSPPPPIDHFCYGPLVGPAHTRQHPHRPLFHYYLAAGHLTQLSSSCSSS